MKRLFKIGKLYRLVGKENDQILILRDNGIIYCTGQKAFCVEANKRYFRFLIEGDLLVLIGRQSVLDYVEREELQWNEN